MTITFIDFFAGSCFLPKVRAKTTQSARRRYLAVSIIGHLRGHGGGKVFPMVGTNTKTPIELMNTP